MAVRGASRAAQRNVGANQATRGSLVVFAGARFVGSRRVPPAPVFRQAQARTLADSGARTLRHAVGTAPSLLEGTITAGSKAAIKYHGVHHVALLVKDLDRSLQFYEGILGLEVNPDRPHHKLPYRGAWLWIGPEMIHLMELDNPDPLTNRPEHGGRDRHFCIGVTDVEPLVEKLETAGIPYTRSMSGRPAVFFRDPDMNCLEVVEQEPWR